MQIAQSLNFQFSMELHNCRNVVTLNSYAYRLENHLLIKVQINQVLMGS